MMPFLEIGLSNAAMVAVLAVLAAGLSRLYRRPAFVHGLWLVVLLKLVTPPLVPIPLPWFASSEPTEPPADVNLAVVLAGNDIGLPQDLPVAGLAHETASPALAGQDSGDGFLPATWFLPILLVWLSGSLVCLVWTIRSVVRFRRLLRFARMADPPLQKLVKELAGKLKRTSPPPVVLVPGKISPMLWALGIRPRLLFPAELLDRLHPEQLRTILLHELAHWRRRDHWVRLLEMVVMVLYWWHPAMWWARAELRDAEELCCDAWVVGVLEGARRTYALALLETVAFFSKVRMPLPVSASGIGQVTQLRRRLTMIMSEPKRRSLTWTGGAALLGLGLLWLPLAPGLAQQPEKKKPAGLQLHFQGLQFQIQGEPGEKEAVELLKKALKILVEKQKPGPAPKPRNPKEIQEARERVQRLSKEVARHSFMLKEARRRLAIAEEQLARLEGKPGAGLHFKIIFQPEKGKTLILCPGTPKKESPKAKAKMLIFPKEMVLQLKDGKIFAAKPAPAQPMDLKRRLEHLLREVEELRRELKGLEKKK